jgi:hypothetical protein
MQYSYDLTENSSGKAFAKLFVEENVGCAKIESWKNKNINFLNYINSNAFTCNMLTSLSFLSYL